MYVNLISGYLKRVLVFALDTIVGRVLLKTLSADALQHCYLFESINPTFGFSMFC